MAIAGVLEALAASEGISRSLGRKTLPEGLGCCQDDGFAQEFCNKYARAYLSRNSLSRRLCRRQERDGGAGAPIIATIRSSDRTQGQHRNSVLGWIERVASNQQV
jgi:hypothetical protein